MISDMKRTQVYLDPKIHAKFKQMAKKHQRTVSAQIRWLMDRWLAEQMLEDSRQESKVVPR